MWSSCGRPGTSACRRSLSISSAAAICAHDAIPVAGISDSMSWLAGPARLSSSATRWRTGRPPISLQTRSRNRCWSSASSAGGPSAAMPAGASGVIISPDAVTAGVDRRVHDPQRICGERHDVLQTRGRAERPHDFLGQPHQARGLRAGLPRPGHGDPSPPLGDGRPAEHTLPITPGPLTTGPPAVRTLPQRQRRVVPEHVAQPRVQPCALRPSPAELLVAGVGGRARDVGGHVLDRFVGPAALSPELMREPQEHRVLHVLAIGGAVRIARRRMPPHDLPDDRHEVARHHVGQQLPGVVVRRRGDERHQQRIERTRVFPAVQGQPGPILSCGSSPCAISPVPAQRVARHYGSGVPTSFDPARQSEPGLV